MTAEMHVVALSGGKDSTALALRLAEVSPALDPVYLCTPTGDELQPMVAHWERLESLLGKPLERVRHKLDLNGLIETYGALPNWRQRWCTRQLKIEPCLAWVARQQASGRDVILHVGLRADEPLRKGIFSESVRTVFDLREWGWGLSQVRGYLRERGVSIPKRTDCARCYGQRLDEWWELWREYPEIWADAKAQEESTGHTFRSPGRDTWPAALAELEQLFEAGHVPRGVDRQLSLPVIRDETEPCRVCRL